MTKVWLDFETYSEIDIKTSGGFKYTHDGSTNIICLGYAFDDEPVQLWTPADPEPTRLLEAIKTGAKVYAHNAIFDYRIWNNIGQRDFGWPVLSLDNLVDTAALCACFSLPLSLDGAGAAMQIKLPKHKDGKALIKQLCQPNKKGGQPLPLDPVYRAAFSRFFAYCKRDVESMREVAQALPRQELIPQEHEVWELTSNMNEHGLPIAYDEVVQIRTTIDNYITQRLPELSKITFGQVTTVNQHARIKKFCMDNGYPMENTQAESIKAALDDPKCTSPVKDVLQFRSELGSAAVAKYKKLLDLATVGKNDYYWIHDNLVYHGAGPGRWTARGFQMQNLPRAKVSNPDEVIKKFFDDDLLYYLKDQKYKNPVQMGKALVRPMIKAPPGYTLIVSDYSSIENRILAWLAGDKETLVDFANNVDQYKTMASSKYKVPYEAVTPEQRFMGKVIILGCGYQMGGPTFQRTCKEQFGFDISIEEAKQAVKDYREKYVLITQLWKGLQLAAIKAVMTGERQTYRKITFGTSTITGTRWLAMLLPSGKSIYYKSPKVKQQYIPKYEHMGKVPTVTAEGRNPHTRKWARLPLTPGRITENATQGFAREIMTKGMLNIQEKMKEVSLIGTVHDEALAIIKKSDLTSETLSIFDHHLCSIPFAKGCPIEAVGYISERYKKD